MDSKALVSAGYPAIKFPDVEHRIDPGFIKGRNLSDGYARGWGLQFGDLHEKVISHPLFIEALHATEGRSIVCPYRLSNLFLIICCCMSSLECKGIVEFGSFKGGSAIFMAYLLEKLYHDHGASTWAHDTFAGMPVTQRSADLHAEGDFLDADLPGLKRIRESLSLDNLHIVEGLVECCFPPSGLNYRSVGLVHFDMDIYSPTAWSQEAIWPYMTSGAYMVYDDATVASCIGATQAVEELIINRGLHSEQIFPHFVFRKSTSDE